MMKLYASVNSPYARKCRVCSIELGIEDQLEVIDTNPRDASTGFWGKNPLGKIPALELASGEVIYDSPVICEYLNEISNGALLPENEKWSVRTLAALADGIMDAAMAARLEGMRPPEEQSATWVEKQLGVAQRGFDTLEAEAKSLGNAPNIATITIACAVFWVGFRHPEHDWLGERPALKAWNDEFSRRPSMTATAP